MTRTAGCTCGSGAHPRRCRVHPDAYDEHVREINAEWAARDKCEEDHAQESEELSSAPPGRDSSPAAEEELT